MADHHVQAHLHVDACLHALFPEVNIRVNAVFVPFAGFVRRIAQPRLRQALKYAAPEDRQAKMPLRDRDERVEQPDFPVRRRQQRAAFALHLRTDDDIHVGMINHQADQLGDVVIRRLRLKYGVIVEGDD